MPEVKCPKCDTNSFVSCEWELMYGDGGVRCNEIAMTNRIRQLESTVARLRKALEEIAALNEYPETEIARTALEETK